MKRLFFVAVISVLSWPAWAAGLPDCDLSIHRVGDDGAIVGAGTSSAVIGPQYVAKIEAKGKDPVTGDTLWQVTLTPEGAALNRQLTKNSIGKYLAIFCDGKLLVKPRVMEAVGGKFFISVPESK